MFLYARSAALLTLAAGFTVISLMGLLAPIKAQPLPAAVVIDYEHRITALEVGLKSIADVQNIVASQITDLRNTKWLELLAVSGLLGEAGFRNFKKRGAV